MMRKKPLWITLLLSIVLLGACSEKDNNPIPSGEDDVHDIVYYVNGENQQATGLSDSLWSTLLDDLLDMAAEGGTVTFYNENSHLSPIPRKENVTFSTTNREEMKDWCRRMEDEGMTVTITYNSDTGVWNGVAYAVLHHSNIAFDENGASYATFSVGEGQTIRFARGILQYRASDNAWRIAEQQFDCVGHANEFAGTGYNGWIDLHEWGAENGAWSAEGFSGWRLLTHSEATYLMTQRNGSTVNGVENARFALAIVNDLHGLILFPDSYSHPEGVAQPVGINNNGMETTPLQENGWYSNRYTIADWQQLEEAGAIFLPTAGRRNGTTVYDFNEYGLYWLADTLGNDKAYVLSVWERYTGTGTAELRQMGGPVRLVRN